MHSVRPARARQRGTSAGPWWRTSEAQRHSTSSSQHEASIQATLLPYHQQRLSTLNPSAEHEQHPSCRPYPAWSTGIAFSRGMPKVSRLPGPAPAEHSMLSWSEDPRHSSNPYSYATSNRYTNSPASVRASLAGTALPVVLSRPQ